MLNSEQIKGIIPHRDPFLLIDYIESIEVGQKAVGFKKIKDDEFYFKGHFPQEPVVPGVLLIESLAQVGAVALLAKEEFKGKIAFFAGIQKARFRKKVVPGDNVRLEVEIIKMKGVIGIGQGKATVDGKVVAEAEMMFAIEK